MPVFMDRDPKNKGKRADRKIELQTGSDFNLSYITAESLLPTLEIVLSEGGALRLGLTRDGGALAVGIYGYGDPQTKYARTETEYLAIMEAVYKAFKGTAE